jgi:hypothetical protein
MVVVIIIELDERTKVRTAVSNQNSGSPLCEYYSSKTCSVHIDVFQIHSVGTGNVCSPVPAEWSQKLVCPLRGASKDGGRKEADKGFHKNALCPPAFADANTPSARHLVF